MERVNLLKIFVITLVCFLPKVSANERFVVLIKDIVKLVNIQLEYQKYILLYDDSFLEEFKQLKNSVFPFNQTEFMFAKIDTKNEDDNINFILTKVNQEHKRKVLLLCSNEETLKSITKKLDTLYFDKYRHQLYILVVTKENLVLASNIHLGNNKNNKIFYLLQPTSPDTANYELLSVYYEREFILRGTSLLELVWSKSKEWVIGSVSHSNSKHGLQTKAKITNKHDKASNRSLKKVGVVSAVSGETKKEFYFGQAKPKKHLVIAAINAPPFIMVTSDINGNKTWSGYCIDFFYELTKYLPYELSWDIYHVPDNRFGTKLSNNLLDKDNKTVKKIEFWSGIIGELYSGRADLALAPMAVMAERELVIDYTVPFYDLVGIQILLKRPEFPQEWFKFLTVLDNEVWLAILVAYLLTSFIMYLFDRLSPYSHKNKARIERLRRKIIVSSEKQLSTFKDHKPECCFLKQTNNRHGQDTCPHYLTLSHEISTGSLSLANKLDTNYNNSLDYLNLTNSNLGKNIDENLIFFAKKSSSITSSDELKSMMNSRNDYINFLKKHSIGKVRTELEKNDLNFRKQSIGENVQDDISDDDSSSSDDEIDDKPDFGFRDSLWFCITSMTPQGGGEAPQNLSGRVVGGAWWLFCFIILASYTANLAAFLTVSRLDIPIKSLDDLSKQHKIKYAPVEGTAEQLYFERMAYIEEVFYNIWKEMSLNDSLSEEELAKFAVWDYPISDKYTKIWSQIQQVGMPVSLDSGVERVKSSTLEDGFALMADANLVKYAVMTDCRLKVVGDEFSRKPIALALRKGQDELRDHLSYATLQLINQRFMDGLREKWWTNNENKATCSSSDNSEGVSAQSLAGVFVIIFVGVAASFIVWCFERLMYNTKKQVSKETMLMNSK